MFFFITQAANIDDKDFLLEGLNPVMPSQGVLHMSKHSSQEGTVQMGSQGSSLMGQILITGRASLNRAMHGDTVAGN